MYKEALKIAYKAHDGQIRRDSLVPYIVHPLRVASQFNDDARKTIAILHDVVEDTDVTLDELLVDFPLYVVGSIDALSRRDDEDYFDYLRRLKQDEWAVDVKIADLVDNMSDVLSPQTDKEIKKYNQALDLLIT